MGFARSYSSGHMGLGGAKAGVKEISFHVEIRGEGPEWRGRGDLGRFPEWDKPHNSVHEKGPLG